MIRIVDLHRSFMHGKNRSTILGGVSFDVPDGKITTIFGPNGCGKSTLMNILSGLGEPDSGTIEGRESLRGATGFVFQDYRRSLLPWGTVEDNIAFPLTLRRVPKRERRERVAKLMEDTALPLNLSQRVISLSGGQAQLVSILRALVIQPRLLLLDEPFAALDYERTLVLRERLSEIVHRMNLTVLCISHDLDEAVALGDQVVFLSRPPTRTVAVLPVDLPHPRGFSVLGTPEFLERKRAAVEYFRECLGAENLLTTAL